MPLVMHKFALDDLREAYDLFSGQRDGVMKVAIYPHSQRAAAARCENPSLSNADLCAMTQGTVVAQTDGDVVVTRSIMGTLLLQRFDMRYEGVNA